MTTPQHTLQLTQMWSRRRANHARRPLTSTYSCAMRAFILTLLIAVTLSACGDVVIGPVDHSCPVNPARGLDSGCSRGGGGGGR